MTFTSRLLWLLFSPSGRLSRKMYARGLIFWAIPTLLAVVQISVAETHDNRLWLMFAVGCLGVLIVANLVSGIMITIKRVHDIGRPAPFAFLIFVPFVGLIAFLYLLFARSRPANRFGAVPDRPA